MSDYRPQAVKSFVDHQDMLCAAVADLLLYRSLLRTLGVGALTGLDLSLIRQHWSFGMVCLRMCRVALGFDAMPPVLFLLAWNRTPATNHADDVDGHQGSLWILWGVRGVRMGLVRIISF